MNLAQQVPLIMIAFLFAYYHVNKGLSVVDNHAKSAQSKSRFQTKLFMKTFRTIAAINYHDIQPAPATSVTLH